MGWLDEVRRSVASRLRRNDEVELDEEIRHHIELETEEYVRRGLSRGEARRRAIAAFGRVEDVKDDVRDVRPAARLLGDAAHDARVALRSLRNQPGFVLAVLLTLGIGIAGNVAMFGVLEVSVFRSLPYPDADRLVLGRVTYEGEIGRTISGPDFFDYRDGNSTLAGFSAITPFEVQATVSGGELPERILAPMVSTGFFSTLGVDIRVGRGFLPEEGEPGGGDVVILSHGYWQRRYAGDPGVVGSSIVIDGTPYAIVGVVQPGFRLITDADAWRPIRRGEGWAEARQFHNFIAVGRLAPGVDIHAARADLDILSARLAAAYPDSNEDKGIALTPLGEALSEGYRSQLMVLGAAVALLLLVACANVAGLLVVRGAARRAEMAIRSVMGAGSGRLARQLLTENGLLALGSVAVGIALAVWLQRGVLALLRIDGVSPAQAGLSPVALAVALGLGGLTTILFGAAPALRVARSEPAFDLRSGRRSSRGRATGRLQSAMVVLQVTLTTVLLIASGLLLRSFDRVSRVDPGFDTDALLTAEVTLPAGDYADVARRSVFYEELETRVAALPGVIDVGLVNRLPVRDGGGNVRVALPERWGEGGVFERIAYQRMVLPGYFEALGIPLLAGRDVSTTDERGGSTVMIISASLAEDLFTDSDPIGRTLGIDVGTDEPWLAEVIGVVGDVVPASLVEGAEHAMYFAYPQRSPASMRLAVRTVVDPAGVVQGIRDILLDLDRNVPLAGVAMMEDVLAASVADRRSLMTTLLAFSAVAVLLAAVGVYGLMAYQVSRRFHEIGVRMALGATVSSVARNVVRRGLLLAAMGVVIAVPISLLAGRLIRRMLFSVGAADPVTYAGVALFFLAVTACACVFPARRAARIDPVDAFRAE
ncbi:MAG: ABC transporter permease [Gemmatimonadota bacterium]|nr:ABC transporter permease [Gemmatimonadota bacterium]